MITLYRDAAKTDAIDHIALHVTGCTGVMGQQGRARFCVDPGGFGVYDADGLVDVIPVEVTPYE